MENELDPDFLDSVALEEHSHDEEHGGDLSGAIRDLNLVKQSVPTPMEIDKIDNEDQENNEARIAEAERFFENIIGELVVFSVMEVERFAKAGLGFLFDENMDEVSSPDRIKSPRRESGRRALEEYKIHESPFTDIFGQPLANMSKMSRQQECVCPECGRTMSALRFAPHLEKCMGFGGRLRTSRRGNNSSSRSLIQPERPSSVGSIASTLSLGAQTRSHTNVIQQETQSDSDNDSGSGSKVSSMAGDDDEDWLTSTKRGKINQSTNNKRRNVTRSTNGRNRHRKPPPILRREEPIIERGTPIPEFDLLNASPSDFLLVDSNEAPVLDLGATETIELRNRKVKKAAKRQIDESLDKFDDSELNDMRLLSDLGDLTDLQLLSSGSRSNFD